jgi:hypothetical protein
MSTQSNNISINVEFIKLARSMRDAQKEAERARHSQQAQRRAKNLETLFDTKLAAIDLGDCILVSP